MNNHRSSLFLLLTVALLSGCASAPNPILEEVRGEFTAAQSNPQVTTLAKAELDEAGDALAKADAAWKDDEDSVVVDHLAYMARRRIEIAQEAAKQKEAEGKVANANMERSQSLLNARTKEAEQYRAQSESSREQARSAEMRAKEMEDKLQRELSAKKTDRGIVITLGEVLFETAKAELKSGGMRNIQKLATTLKRNPERNVLIEGFTDSVGEDSYNQGLSERRAQAVKDALVGLGIEPDRVTIRGYGENFPVANNATPSGRQMNRRVEIVVSDEGGEITPREGT